jgi:hypothetical protein
MSSPDYVRVSCTECRAPVRVETTALGDWVTCPKCSCDFRAKAPSDAPKPKPPAARPVSRNERDDSEESDRDERDEDDRDRRGRRDERDRDRRRGRDRDEDDDRDRRRKKNRDDDDRDRQRKKNRDDDRDRGRSRRRDRDDEDEDEYGDEGSGEPEPGICPNCGSRRSSKVTFTWWGGLVGPAVFHIVRCSRCGKQYNSKTGKSIGAAQIVVYTVVILAILGAVLLTCAGLARLA